MKFLSPAIGVFALSIILPAGLQAAPFAFTDEDLLLAVHTYSGAGSSQNLYFKLGNTVTIKNSPNQGIVGNIAEDLEDTFGTGWFARTDVYFGVFGNRSSLSATLDPGVPPQEPGRTVYVSTPTAAPGTATLRPALTSNQLGNAAGGFGAIRGYLTGTTPGNTDTFTATASGATILDESLHPVSWNTSWTSFNPPGGAAAFTAFTNGIQNGFGTGSEVLVDVQRMVGSTPTTYVTTVGIDSAGNVRLFTSSVATPFQTWALTFPALDTPAKRLPDADPDLDGTQNLMEFLLNGNPGTSDPAILPDLDTSGSNFVFTFNRRDDAETGATLLFQYGSDLSGWTNAAIGPVGSVVGNATIAVLENGTAPDAITVTVPKTVAAGGRLFGRIRYTQP